MQKHDRRRHERKLMKGDLSSVHSEECFERHLYAEAREQHQEHAGLSHGEVRANERLSWEIHTAAFTADSLAYFWRYDSRAECWQNRQDAACTSAAFTSAYGTLSRS